MYQPSINEGYEDRIFSKEEMYDIEKTFEAKHKRTQ